MNQKSKNPLDLADFIALPGMPSTKVEISPGVFVPVDPAVMSIRKEELKQYCSSIPPEEVVTWRGLLPRMGGNETLSKLLISLGDMLGVWTQHPPVNSPYAWLPEHPVVLIHSVSTTSSVPKPSAGGLEAGLITCDRCGVSMGPFGSILHDYVEAEPDSKCISYDPEKCEMLEGAPKKKAAIPKPSKDFDDLPPDAPPEGKEKGAAPSGLDAYLRSLNDE